MTNAAAPTQEAIELKPCRKCGSTKVGRDQFSNRRNRWVIECSDCDYMTETCETPEEAERLWNTRTPILEGDEALERAVKAIFQRLRGFRLSNMADEDGDGYPLIDLLSTPGTTVATGEEQLGEIAFEAAEALASLPPTPSVSRILAEALEPFVREASGWDADQNDGHVFADGDRAEEIDSLTVGDFRKARNALAQYNATAPLSSASTPEGEPR